MRAFFRRLRARIKYRHFERDLAHELEQHRALAEAELTTAGRSARDARWQAARQLGNTTLAREDSRATWIPRLWQQLTQDVRYAVRGLRRAPGFALVASLTLALGIGANTAIFSVVDAAMFRPVPYKDADRLVDVYRVARTRSGEQIPIQLDGSRVQTLREIPSVFEGAEAYGTARPIALATGSDQSPWIGGFGPTLPAFLGVSPQLGRSFTPDDVRAGNAIIISDSYWQRAFGRDGNVLGAPMALADRNCVIVGVMPPTLRTVVGADADAWLPIDERTADNVIARLRPGLAAAQAQRDLDAALLRRSADTASLQLKIDGVGWNRAPAATRIMLLSVTGAVAFVLLIACANVANLLLARTISRQREIAVRAALGASRLQLMRQFFVEGMVLAALGGVEAALVSWWSIRAIPMLMPAKLAQSMLSVALPAPDLRVFGVGAIAVLVTGVLCAIAPAIRASAAIAADGLLAGGQRVAGLSRAQRRVRRAFQSLQIALTLVLLVGALLLTGSVWRLVSTPAGFDEGHLGYLTLDIPSRLFPEASQRSAIVDELLARLPSLPGVRSGAIGMPPSAGGTSTIPLSAERRPDRSVLVKISAYSVGANYFEVAGIAITEGRSFSAVDGPSAPHVVIISDNLARQLWPDRSAVGERLQRGTETDLYTVVGVVRRLRTIALASDDVQTFFPASQSNVQTSLVLRVDNQSTQVAAAVRTLVHAIDPRVTVRRIGTPDGLYAEFDPASSPRFYAILLGILAALGLLTATVGLYGLSSYAVNQRRREIGVRLAMGADIRNIRRLVIVDALGPLAIGVAAGLIASLWLATLLASQLFHVTPRDPMSIAASVAVLVMASAIAVLIPMRRATRIDAAEALRAE